MMDALFPPHDLTRIASDALKSWSRCRRQFAFKYVRRLQWPSDTRNFRLGKDVHKLMDYQARGLDVEPLLHNALSNVKQTWQKLAVHRAAQWPVIASEWAFHVPVHLPGERVEWLTGRMDRFQGMKRAVCGLLIGKPGPASRKRSGKRLANPSVFVRPAGSSSHTIRLGFGLVCKRPTFSRECRVLYAQSKADASTPIREVAIEYNAKRHAETRERLQETLLAMSTEEQYSLPAACPDRFCVYRPICGIDSLDSLPLQTESLS